MSCLKLTEIEKTKLKNEILGMSDIEQVYTLMYYPTSALQAELIRREEMMNRMTNDLQEKMGGINSNMTLNDKEALINDIAEILISSYEDKKIHND